jgi:hypothetical protein
MTKPARAALVRVGSAILVGIAFGVAAPESHVIAGCVAAVVVWCVMVAAMIPGPGRGRAPGLFTGPAGDAWAEGSPYSREAPAADPLPWTDQEAPESRRLRIEHVLLAAVAFTGLGALTVVAGSVWPAGSKPFSYALASLATLTVLTLAMRIGIAWTMLAAMFSGTAGLTVLAIVSTWGQAV